ncbi:MAG: polyprenyldihydroxybenzoate methyltransferase / 3-demethylubiquinol 3-O-methyltransferase [Verrucomicrobiota bacterium]|jgi:SAM-dependent methyltransferase
MDQYSYSEKYFTEGMTGWHALSYGAISEAFRNFAGGSPIKRLLDFGCGDGFYGGLLSEHTDRLDGVDLSATVLSDGNRRCYHEVFETDLGRPWKPPGELYDALFSSEVIEHVEDYQQFLDNAFHATKPGGKLFLTTTTYSFALFVLLTNPAEGVTLTALLEFARGWFGNLECRSRFVRRIWGWTKGHHHGFSKRQLREAIEKSGFNLERMAYLHVQPVIDPGFFRNPFRNVRFRRLILLLLPVCRFFVRLVNYTCRKWDLYAPNVVLIAVRPGTETSGHPQRESPYPHV